MSKPLTHHECHVLAIIGKWQPVTAYVVRKLVPKSLASTFSDSPGSVYPIIKRLKDRGLVVAEELSDGRLNSEVLSCTVAGEAAIRSWLVEVLEADSLPEDPWRTRALFADILAPDERRRSLLAMRAAAADQLSNIAERLELAGSRTDREAIEGARLFVEARLVWVDRLLAGLVMEEREAG